MKTVKRSIPKPAPYKKGSPFVDDDKLYIEFFCVKHRIEKIHCRHKPSDKDKVFPVKGGHIIKAWQAMEQWLARQKP